MIVLNDLRVGYFKCQIGPEISGKFPSGSITAIVGSSGVGKTTLLKTLAGFLPPISGNLKFSSKIHPFTGYLPQKINVDHNFPLTVFDVVSMGCWSKDNFFKRITKVQRNNIYHALDQVRLLDFKDRNINCLSGGQFQRMFFARLLVQRASLILLDEPFQGIDYSICHLMIISMKKLCQIGCTIIVVLHDNELVHDFFSKILLLTDLCSIWKRF